VPLHHLLHQALCIWPLYLVFHVIIVLI
jgi:hypothetical protein